MGGHDRVDSEVQRLVAEQVALRRVATLVARGAPPEDVFRAVASEVSALFGSDVSALLRFEDDGTATVLGDIGGPHEAGARVTLDAGYVVHTVRETRASARFDTADPAAAHAGTLVSMIGVQSAVASPIVVEGELWGAITVASLRAPLAPVAERRLTEFTELVATAIGNAGARAELSRLADEQAALRRVAELVARESSRVQVFNAVTHEAWRVLETEAVGLLRFESDGTATLVAQSRTPWEPPPLGTRFTLDGENVIAEVARTGRAARADDWANATGAVAAMARVLGVRSIVGTPILVAGRLWGTLIAATSGPEPLPADTARRVEQFAELVATAIANAEARAQLSRLADEQAALRRIAELVAREASQTEVFTTTTDAIGRLLGREPRMVRYDCDGAAVIVAAYSDGAHSEILPVGARLPLGGNNALSRVFETGAPARIDDYRAASGPIAEAVRGSDPGSVVATPIVVQGRPWGAMLIATFDEEPVPAETEWRLGQFTELMATAIANAEARAEIERLANEQAALRRVATLVAEGASPGALFDAVTVEVERLLDADAVSLVRYEPDEQVTTLVEAPGARVRHRSEDLIAAVRDSGGAARMQRHAPGEGVSVGAPIVVGGRLWGIAMAHWSGERPPPAGTEQRMAQFAQLLETAIANADSLDQLRASRARLVTAGDAARRRVVRDLHDGAQQRLVHTIVTLKLARQALRADPDRSESLLGKAIEYAEQGNAELRELAHGILPALLTNGGLGVGIDALVERLDFPVRVDVPAARFEPELEASAYFIIAETLTNVAKHARASAAEVKVYERDGMLHVEVSDDGVGGADQDGHGLLGLADRATGLGGRFEVQSPALGGTRVAATLPLAQEALAASRR
jgi:signal transduction histidine kinase